MRKWDGRVNSSPETDKFLTANTNVVEEVAQTEDGQKQDTSASMAHDLASLSGSSTPFPDVLLKTPARGSGSPFFKSVKLIATEDDLSREAIARLDTMSMFVVQPREEVGLQQQDIFINDRREAIARQETLRLPIVLPSSDQQTTFHQADKRRDIASTAGGAAIAGVGDIISSLLRYATNVVMTHLVAQSVYGLFIEASTVATVAGYASKLGLDSATLRFLSTYRSKGEGSLAIGIIKFASRLALLSGVICALLFFCASSLLAHMVYHKDSYVLPFKEAALLIPLIGMQLVVASGLQALKAIRWKVYIDRLIQPGVTLILLIAFYMAGLRLEALLLATICGYLASTITGQVLLRLALRKLVQETVPRYEPKMWMRFALPMFFNSMIRNILNSTDILFLGAVTASSQVGLYGAADRVSYFVVAPLIALNVIFSPVIAEYHASGRYERLEAMFKVVTKWSFTLSLPIFLCCILFQSEILGVFGQKYLSAGVVLSLLALGNLVDSGVGSVNYLLVMTGRPRVILLNTATTVVVNVTLAITLVPRLGIVGAALAAALTVIVLNIVGLIEVYQILHIHPYRRDVIKPVIAGIGASLVGLVLMRIVHVEKGYLAIVGLLGLMIPFMLVYIGILAALRLSEEDLMVFEVLRSRLSKRKVQEIA